MNQEIIPFRPAGSPTIPDRIARVELYGALLADADCEATRKARVKDVAALGRYLGLEPGRSLELVVRRVARPGQHDRAGVQGRPAREEAGAQYGSIGAYPRSGGRSGSPAGWGWSTGRSTSSCSDRKPTGTPPGRAWKAGGRSWPSRRREPKEGRRRHSGTWPLSAASTIGACVASRSCGSTWPMSISTASGWR